MRGEAAQISVVVPFLNARRYLEAAIESVFRQSFTRWEMVLVDGGSSDGSRELAQAIARKRPGQVRVVSRRRAEVLGIFESRVLGARESRAPLVALLDSDDEYDPRLLAERFASYRGSFADGDGLVYGPGVLWWEGGQKPRLALQKTPRPGLYRPPGLFAAFLKAGYVQTPCTTGTLLSRRMLLESGQQSGVAGQHMIEDQYLWFEIARHHPIRVTAPPLFWYRQRPDSTCALGLRSGQFHALRRRHLQWLHAQVRLTERGQRRSRLTALVDRALAA